MEHILPLATSANLPIMYIQLYKYNLQMGKLKYLGLILGM